jgi:hypothetical protein
MQKLKKYTRLLLTSSSSSCCSSCYVAIGANEARVAVAHRFRVSRKYTTGYKFDGPVVACDHAAKHLHSSHSLRAADLIPLN